MTCGFIPRFKLYYVNPWTPVVFLCTTFSNNIFFFYLYFVPTVHFNRLNCKKFHKIFLNCFLCCIKCIVVNFILLPKQ